MSPSRDERIDGYAQRLGAVRQQSPLVHNITNLVVQNDTADAIAAVGGVQMTLHAPAEAAAAAALADALVVNVGTPDPAWLEAAHTAVAVAAQRRRPWLLDPVAAGFSDYRTGAIERLLALGPTVLKANASEVLALAGAGVAGRAADSAHSVDAAAEAAQVLAARHGCVVAVTGDCDLVSDGVRSRRLGHGRPVLGRMVGSGCMLGAVVACFLAGADEPFAAVVAAIVCFTIAGEIAAEQAGGPGTLKPLLIDALYNLDDAGLAGRL